MCRRVQRLLVVVCASLALVVWIPALCSQEGPRPTAPPNQANILAEVTRLKGGYKADPNGRDKRPWAITLSGENVTDRHIDMLQYLDDLLELHLIKVKVTDAGLAPLAKYKTLRSVRVYDCAVGDKGVAHLVQIKSLVELKLSATKVTDAGLKTISQLKLTVLELNNTAVTDDAVPIILRMPSVRTVHVKGTQISPKLLKELDSGRVKFFQLTPTPPVGCAIAARGGRAQPMSGSAKWRGFGARSRLRQ